MIARVLVLLVAILFAAPAFALSGVFRDGFESGDDRYWTGPLETCRAPDDDPAPLCSRSMDVEPWLFVCEEWPVRCYHICAPEYAGGGDCLFLWFHGLPAPGEEGGEP